MSLKTWKKEFYPTPAALVSQRNAVEHSIKKWTGLLKSNLKKHGVYVERGWYPPIVVEDDGDTGLHVDSGSCALCFHYFQQNQADTLCGDCPLYKALGNFRCDTVRQPYTIFLNDLNPKPMLVQLRRARKFDTAAKAKP